MHLFFGCVAKIGQTSIQLLNIYTVFSENDCVMKYFFKRLHLFCYECSINGNKKALHNKCRATIKDVLEV